MITLALGEGRGQIDMLGALPQGATSGQDTVSRWYDVIGSDAAAFCRAGAHIGTAPLRWDGCDLLRAGAVIGLTGVAALADADARDIAARNHTTAADNMESGVRLYGEAWILTGLAGGTYLAGLVLEDDWLRETAFLAGTSLILATTATRILKIVVGRGRPYQTTDPATFRMLSVTDAYNAFPSGHSTAAFAVSTVLAHRINCAWATAGLYGLATLTSLSRVYSAEHWFSDIVFGALFSTALTESVIGWYEGERGNRAQTGFRLLPAPGGITLVYSF